MILKNIYFFINIIFSTANKHNCCKIDAHFTAFLSQKSLLQTKETLVKSSVYVTRASTLLYRSSGNCRPAAQTKLLLLLKLMNSV